MTTKTDKYVGLRAALSRVEDGPWWLAGDLPNEVRPLNPVVRGRVDGSARLTICRTGTNNHTQRDWNNAAYIAACSPDVIRALLDERDALLEALEKLLAGTRAETAESWQCNSYHPKLISGMDAAAALVQRQEEA